MGWKDIFSPANLWYLTLNISRLNGFIQLQQQQQPGRMWWICLIGTSKSNIFQRFRKSVREKQPDFLAKCCCDASTWYEHTRLTHSAGPESFTTWRKWFTCPNPPSCLIPWGAGAEVGAMLGYQSVFLPSFPFLFFFFSLLTPSA